jgi:CHAT domain-containing protein
MDGSFLALRGRHLSAAEIKRLQYHREHPFVVMSSCQSGLGKTINAGVFGLARAWVHAGAAQVLASLWNVDDLATSRLMTRFISYYLGGMGRQRALRQAMLETRSYNDDVALWGGFTLFGYPQLEK